MMFRKRHGCHGRREVSSVFKTVPERSLGRLVAHRQLGGSRWPMVAMQIMSSFVNIISFASEQCLSLIDRRKWDYMFSILTRLGTMGMTWIKCLKYCAIYNWRNNYGPTFIEKPRLQLKIINPLKCDLIWNQHQNIDSTDIMILKYFRQLNIKMNDQSKLTGKIQQWFHDYLRKCFSFHDMRENIMRFLCDHSYEPKAFLCICIYAEYADAFVKISWNNLAAAVVRWPAIEITHT